MGYRSILAALLRDVSLIRGSSPSVIRLSGTRLHEPGLESFCTMAVGDFPATALAATEQSTPSKYCS